MEPLVEVRDMAMGFAGKPIQKDLSFDVNAGDVFLVLGGSGTGKSTLLRHMIGLQAPLAGSVTLTGVGDPQVWSGCPPFGVAFQGGALFGSMTLLQNVSLPLTTWTRLDRETVQLLARSKLALVGLAGFENHSPAAISGGMRKRAAIARALALEPKLLFLDEPSAGLDPISAAELDDLILSLNQDMGTTLVIVTHELASIYKVGSRCIMLDRETRTIIATGNPRELRDTSDDLRVRRFFHREARQ